VPSREGCRLPLNEGLLPANQLAQISRDDPPPSLQLHYGFIAHKHEGFYEPLFGRLRELGYEEGRNLIVERRYAQGHADRFQEFADEMVQLNVDVIIVVTTPAAQAAKRATSIIPIVHPAVIDPVGTGLVAS